MRVIFWTLLIIGGAIAAAWFGGPWWLSDRDGMNEPRSEIHAAALDGRIYVAGGIGFFRTLSSCAAFHAAAEQWADCPDLPRSLHHVGMAAGDGKVFASGGYVSLPFNQDPDGALFMLDVAGDADRWVELAPLPAPLGQHAMFYRDNAVWLIGGESGGETTGALWRYDLAKGEWSERAAMPTPRHSHGIALDDNKLYVTGGRSRELGFHSLVIEAYDFEADAWESLPDASFPLGGHGAAVVAGRLHVFGGEDIDTAEVFTRHASLALDNPDAGWRDEPEMAFPRHGLATATVDQKIWVIGGGKRAGMRTPWSVTNNAFALERN